MTDKISLWTYLTFLLTVIHAPWVKRRQRGREKKAKFRIREILLWWFLIIAENPSKTPMCNAIWVWDWQFPSEEYNTRKEHSIIEYPPDYTSYLWWNMWKESIIISSFLRVNVWCCQKMTSPCKAGLSWKVKTQY
jgi:hypothetical protein